MKKTRLQHLDDYMDSQRVPEEDRTGAVIDGFNTSLGFKFYLEDLKKPGKKKEKSEGMNLLELMVLIILLILIFRPGCCKGQVRFTLDDKDKHFLISSNLACAGSIIAYKITDRPIKSIAAVLFGTIAIGALKEGIYDGAMHRGVMDWKGDFIADVTGAITGAFIAGGCIAVKKHFEEKIDQSKYDLTHLSYEDLERLKAAVTYNETPCNE